MAELSYRCPVCCRPVIPQEGRLFRFWCADCAVAFQIRSTEQAARALARQAYAEAADGG